MVLCKSIEVIVDTNGLMKRWINVTEKNLLHFLKLEAASGLEVLGGAGDELIEIIKIADLPEGLYEKSISKLVMPSPRDGGPSSTPAK